MVTGKRLSFSEQIVRVWMEGNLKWFLAVAGYVALAFAAAAGTLFLSPPPVVWLLPLALCLMAVWTFFFTGLKGGIFLRPLWRLPGVEKRVALTFDDGPHPEFTPMILEALRAFDVKATFFLLGEAVEKHPLLAEAIVRDGHAVGSHGYSHRSMKGFAYTTLRGEIERTERLLENLGVHGPGKLFRPPAGAKSPLLEFMLRRRGYRLVLWSLSPKDWKPLPPGVIFRRLTGYVEPGSVILLHDGTMAAQVLPDFLREMRGRGYAFVPLHGGVFSDRGRKSQP